MTFPRGHSEGQSWRNNHPDLMSPTDSRSEDEGVHQCPCWSASRHRTGKEDSRTSTYTTNYIFFAPALWMCTTIIPFLPKETRVRKVKSLADRCMG